MTIIPKNLSKEISDKYSVVSNAFRLANVKNSELDQKATPKDLIVAEIGDTKQLEFYPQLKLGRWGDTDNDNEVNFSIRLRDTEIGVEEISTLQNKIKWSKGNIDIEFYDFIEDEGGYKMVWYLKSKPTSNKIEFTIQSKGLDFFYQPELTPEEIAGGTIRPENIVGSYAVYYKNKGGMNDINGKDYKAGKAFHIFRPHIIDAVGKETWGILKIANGIYSVEIPQAFLDTAIYPIKSNDTFGYTGVGGTGGPISLNTMGGQMGTATNAGLVDSVSFYVARATAGTTNFKGLVVLASNLNILTNGVGSPVAINSTTPQWWSSSYSTKPSVSASTNYYAANIPETDGVNVYYDTIAGYTIFFDATNSYATPSNPTDASVYTDVYRYSLYATYTPSGGAISHKLLSMLGVG